MGSAELPGIAQPTCAIRAGAPESWRNALGEDLSASQTATAVLLLLLESDAPQIVDQPEDDLDNRFIADGIVLLMHADWGSARPQGDDARVVAKLPAKPPARLQP